MAGVPAEVHERVERFVGKVVDAVGGSLVSVCAYGSLARGGYDVGVSDLNIVIVLGGVDAVVLSKIEPFVGAARLELSLNILYLEIDELPLAIEAFPIKMLDIQRHHLLLAGKDVFSGLDLSPERLRRQCLRQILNSRLRMRNQWIALAAWPERRRLLLQECAGSFLFELSVAVELLGAGAPTSHEDALGKAAYLGLDVEVVRELCDLGDVKVANDSPAHEATCDRLMTLLGTVLQKLKT